MMFPEDDAARTQMAAANEVEGDREASASMPPVPMDDRTLDDDALDDDPAADQHNDYYDTKHNVRIPFMQFRVRRDHCKVQSRLPSCS